MTVAAPARPSESTGPRISFKTTRSAHGITADATLLFLTRVPRECPVLSGGQTQTDLLRNAITLCRKRQWVIVQKVNDYTQDSFGASGDTMRKFMKYLEDLLKPDSELQLVGNWAQRPSDSTTIRLPALHSLVCVDRMNVQIALKRRLLANMREWPLHHFFKVASHWADGYCNDANERQNATGGSTLFSILFSVLFSIL